MENELLQAFFNQAQNISSSDSNSSTDSSLDSDNELHPPRKRHKRNENYFEVTVPNYLDDDFKRHFRMCRNSVSTLCDLINLPQNYVGGWPEISKLKAIHITLYYLANTNTFREVADKFNITESACYNTISAVIIKLKELSTDYVKLPQRNKFDTIATVFETNQGLPYAIGAIDCTHFQIPRPKNNQEDYYNRKGYHSIIMQGVVDDKKVFVDIYVGEPGSLHDARVIRKSPLYNRLEASQELSPYYFLCDSAYSPSLYWLVPPFKDNGNLSENQKQFNQRLSKKRVIVEHAFGLLKGRFRRLTSFSNKRIDFVVNCIVAAVVLHNLCIMWDDLGEEFGIDQHLEYNYEGPRDENIIGNIRRDELFNYLFNN